MSKDDSSGMTYDELFQNFTQIAGEKDMVTDETSESLQRVVNGNGTKADQDRLMNSLESWLEQRFEGDSNE